MALGGRDHGYFALILTHQEYQNIIPTPAAVIPITFPYPLTMSGNVFKVKKLSQRGKHNEDQNVSCR